MTGGEWFTYSITPLPHDNDVRFMLLADIYDQNCDKFLVNLDGSLAHSKRCTKQKHTLPSHIEKAVALLKPKAFEVAIWTKEIESLYNQPIFFAINPEISHYSHLYHPHLNAIQKADKFIPESICYETKFDFLDNNNPVSGILTAFGKVALWFVKFQLWEQLMIEGFNPIESWIGKQHIPDSEELVKYWIPYRQIEMKAQKNDHERIMGLIKKRLNY